MRQEGKGKKKNGREPDTPIIYLQGKKASCSWRKPSPGERSRAVHILPRILGPRRGGKGRSRESESGRGRERKEERQEGIGLFILIIKGESEERTRPQSAAGKGEKGKKRRWRGGGLSPARSAVGKDGKTFSRRRP